jgi:hypothetical protein
MSALRIVQYFELIAFAGSQKEADKFANSSTADTVTLSRLDGAVVHRYQNYFVNELKGWPTDKSAKFAFAPFEAQGAISNLNGDNSVVQVLFPNTELALRLVEQGNGNHLSRLTLTTRWMNEDLEKIREYSEYYIGVGASFSETTVELRFRSAMDSVGSRFPSRTFTRSLVGILPLNADLRMQ